MGTHSLVWIITITLVCMALIGICLLVHAFRIRKDGATTMFVCTLTTSIVALAFPVALALIRFAEETLIIGAVVCGTALVLIDIRRIGFELTMLCRRCRYDLSGLMVAYSIRERAPMPGATTRCPECGFEINSRRRLRLAKCRKSTRYRLGLTLIFGVIAWVSWPAAASPAEFDWRKRVSASILAWDLERRHEASTLRTLGEIRRRLKSGESASVELTPVTDALLNRWENPARHWPSRWTWLLEDFVESGTMSETQVRRYFSGLMSVMPEVVGSLRPGEPFQLVLHGEDNAEMSKSRLNSFTRRMQSRPSKLWNIIDSDIIEVELGWSTIPVDTRREWSFPTECYVPRYRILERSVEAAPESIHPGSTTMRVLVRHTAIPARPVQLPVAIHVGTPGLPVEWFEVFEIPVDIGVRSPQIQETSSALPSTR